MENQTEVPTSKSSSLLHYIAYSFLTLVIIILAYLNSMPQEEVTSVETNATQVSFEGLPYNVQVQYKTKDEFEKIEKKLNIVLKEKQSFLDEIAFLQEKVSTQTMPTSESKMIKEEPKQMISKSFTQSSSNSNVVLGSAKLIKDFAKCYDMEMGKYTISSQCRKNIIAFVDKHKKAKYFEIIGIVDEAEFLLYRNLERNNFIYDKLKITQHSIDMMKQLSQSGLAKYRSIEANWVIKAHTKRKAKVYNANYNLLSDNGKKGVVIRAYK